MMSSITGTRTFTRLVLSAMFLLVLVATIGCLYWLSDLPPDMSDIKYIGAIGMPTTLILGLAKVFEQMYNRYMEKGVQIIISEGAKKNAE
jgi:hypothetical protein